jgi:PAS domain S-box-containing protein
VATSDESRFERLLEEASDAAFILDPLEDRILAANGAACAMLGSTLEELLETPVSEIHPGERRQLQDFLAAVLREGHGSTLALTCRTRSGQYLPTEMTLWAFDGGARVHVLALIRDRSEHRARSRDE